MFGKLSIKITQILCTIILFSIILFSCFSTQNVNARAQEIILHHIPFSTSLDCSSNPWQLSSTLINRRLNHSATVYGDHIYVLGGEYGNVLSSVEHAVINPDGTLGEWQTVSSLTIGRAHLAAVAANGFLYAIGGTNPELGWRLDVEYASINPDGSLGPWQILSSTLSVGSYISAVVAGNFIYIFGGVEQNQTIVSNIVQRSFINQDGTLGTWQQMNPLKTTRKDAGAAIYGDYIFVVGGDNEFGVINKVERAPINTDGSLGGWEYTNLLLNRRTRPGVVALQGYLYAIGGYNVSGGANYMNSVERALINLDGTIGSWQLVNPMNFQRGFAATTNSSSRIYVVAGANLDEPDVSNSVEWANTANLGTPNDNRITINNGDVFTNQPLVTLSICAQEGINQMQISNDGGFTGAYWETYTTSRLWTLVQYGSYVIPRTVYIRFMFSTGAISGTYQDDIILDVTPPTGSVTLVPSSRDSLQTWFDNNLNIEVARNTLQIFIYLPIISKPPMKFVLHLSAQDDVSAVRSMMISNSSNFSGAVWEPFTTIKDWTVVSTGGIIKVYVKYKDFAGNVSLPIEGSYFP